MGELLGTAPEGCRLQVQQIYPDLTISTQNKVSSISVGHCTVTVVQPLVSATIPAVMEIAQGIVSCYTGIMRHPELAGEQHSLPSAVHPISTRHEVYEP